jgi:hypothetical protein
MAMLRPLPWIPTCSIEEGLLLAIERSKAACPQSAKPSQRRMAGFRISGSEADRRESTHHGHSNCAETTPQGSGPLVRHDSQTIGWTVIEMVY